jgi:membrane associated rhomboid family serine protease
MEACNCALHPDRLYMWAGFQLTARQILGTRLCIDMLSYLQGGRVDYAAHLGGVATGVVFSVVYRDAVYWRRLQSHLLGWRF